MKADEMTESPSVRAKYDFRRQLGRPLRVGGIDYLNSRPLIERLADIAGDEVALSNHPPSELARRLREGALDVALVPVLEYYLAPRSSRYWIIPGIGISSYGAVDSIRLFVRASLRLGEICKVGLDRSSLTSVFLTKLLFAERPDGRWQPRSGTPRPPTFEPVAVTDALALLGGGDPRDHLDALLLIGDPALEAPSSPGWSSVDLGLEWTRWTGLPFVYAFWVFQGDPIAGVVDCFRRGADSGCADIDRIVSSRSLPGDLRPEEGRHYLGHLIRYRLGEAEIRGLEVFISRLKAHGLIHSGNNRRALRFLDEEG